MRAIAATVLAVLLAASAHAAEVTGKWKSSLQGPDGQSMEMTFTLKAEGKTLTGTAAGPMGEMAISNGKVEGDTLSFDVDAGGMLVKHAGTLAGDTIKLKVHFDGGAMPDMEMTLTRLPAGQ